MKVISWNLVHIIEQGKAELTGTILSENFHKMQISKHSIFLTCYQLNDYEEKIKNICGKQELKNYIREMQKVSEEQHKLRKQYIKDWRKFQKEMWSEK